VETTHEVSEEFEDALAVDLGERHMATSVALSNRSTTFYGEKHLLDSGTLQATPQKRWKGEDYYW
jgi:hypothetical protein